MQSFIIDMSQPNPHEKITHPHKLHHLIYIDLLNKVQMFISVLCTVLSVWYICMKYIHTYKEFILYAKCYSFLASTVYDYLLVILLRIPCM